MAENDVVTGQTDTTTVDTNQAETVVSYTQEDFDKGVSNRLARERDKFAKILGIESYSDETIEQWKASRSQQETLQQEQTTRIADITAQSTEKDYLIAAMQKGVTSENLDRAIKLAKTEVSDDVTIEQAIENVLSDFPMLKGEVTQTKVKIGDEVTRQTDSKTEVDHFLDKYKDSKYFKR